MSAEELLAELAQARVGLTDTEADALASFLVGWLAGTAAETDAGQADWLAGVAGARSATIALHRGATS